MEIRPSIPQAQAVALQLGGAELSNPLPPEFGMGLANIAHGFVKVAQKFDDLLFDSSVKAYQVMLGINSQIHYVVGAARNTIASAVPYIDSRKAKPLALATLLGLVGALGACAPMVEIPVLQDSYENLAANMRNFKKGDMIQGSVYPGCSVAVKNANVRAAPEIESPVIDIVDPAGPTLIIENELVVKGGAVGNYSQGSNWMAVKFPGDPTVRFISATRPLVDYAATGNCGTRINNPQVQEISSDGIAYIRLPNGTLIPVSVGHWGPSEGFLGAK